MKNCKFKILVSVLIVRIFFEDFSTSLRFGRNDSISSQASGRNDSDSVLNAQTFEKIDSAELEPFYIDEEETHLILELFDKENLYRTVKKAGGISVPDSEYAQNLIRKFTAQYLTKKGNQRLCEVLDDAEIYRLYIRKELKKRKMPAALEYLPVVESEYSLNAKSRSGATGMWQFMENSISPFLTKNEYIDERLDPWLSTDAALSKLQDNYRVFKDWPLAIAAYNCGAGAMKKVLESEECKKKTFWYAAENGLLRDESVNYVPKLLAITALTEHPERYDITLPEISEAAEIYYSDFDYITVNDSVSLEWLSQELRLDFDTLKKLNNSLVKDVTPPDQSYILRLPAGMKEAAEMCLTICE